MIAIVHDSGWKFFHIVATGEGVLNGFCIKRLDTLVRFRDGSHSKYSYGYFKHKYDTGQRAAQSVTIDIKIIKFMILRS